MSDLSFIFNAHPSYIDSLYESYKKDPDSVGSSWKTFFYGFDFQEQSSIGTASTTDIDPSKLEKEFAVIAIIHGFRQRGHLLSTTNPIKQRVDRQPHLNLDDYLLNSNDLDKIFDSGKEIGLKNATLAQILYRLNEIYTGNIGIEYTHIENKEKRMWLREKIESMPSPKSSYGHDIVKKRRILQKLNDATIFEKFLHTKYVGQKRFGLEGGESTIVGIDTIVNKGSDLGVQDVLIGMAHRGRLNILASIIGKTYDQIFGEFEGTAVPELSYGDGDVKYHAGFSSQPTLSNGKKIQIQLATNPSHLEAVDPVLEGMARAKADILYKSDYDKILPILIHGDSAIAGQGIVYETVQMSQLKGYYTGGTIHFVTNNQIGFTTNFDDARSSTYCTAAASLVQAPVFHVNGDDPEALVWATELAVEYRQKFNNDVFIDMVCYRKHGHNEADDPQFTQPEMYKLISRHKNPRDLYVEKLISDGEANKSLADELEKDYWKILQERLDEVKQKPLLYIPQTTEESWKSLRFTEDKNDFLVSPPTGVAKDKVLTLLDHITTLPKDFHPLKKIDKLLNSKKEIIQKGYLDWATGELLAYASILETGKNVRISGQDVKRGTFSHRHVVVNDSDTFDEYNRLNGIHDKAGKLLIYNSLLSEFAVLGFEYGYSLICPDHLVIWEAQFGDFFNGAQTIVDQFVTAAESKWQRMSGLVMLLPHGHEGQGPEHSSARLERFLQASAEFNITVSNCTTPANFFHILRRQLAREFRKPLINMSPKSILRHPDCISPLEDFYEGTKFREVIDDAIAIDTETTIVLLCSGKIYFDLTNKRSLLNRKDVAIVRIEQLYPLPDLQIEGIFAKYSKAKFKWVQEEPKNMGAWTFLSSNLPWIDVECISRKNSASTATGFKKQHDLEQENILIHSFE